VLFSSLIFLFVFLPIILLVYYAMPRKGKNAVLFVFSLLFYAWGGVSYTAILVISILFNFWFARRISNVTNTRKRWLFIGLTFNIVVLATFKYLVFFIDNINDISWLMFDGYKPITELKIILPLGISFFTFQQMSMLWDIYREEKPLKPRFLDTALYISFFPQLVAGPIVRYHDIIDQIKSRTESFELMNSGISRFIIGLFKKVVFANTCAMVADPIMECDYEMLSTSAAWLGILAYTLQIYFDFSGYSDMAIGLGRMFGFRILENFNLPYISRSIKEFWRRWHISLSSWFKDYVYIPIGGNRFGVRRTYINLMLVFLLTGFWHGATWSFIVFGLYHGLFLVFERIGFGKFLERIPSVLSWSYSIFIVMIGWVIFRTETLDEASSFIAKLFGSGDGQISALSYLDPEKITILGLCIVASFPLNLKPNFTLDPDSSLYISLSITKNFVYLALFLYTVMVINSGSYSPFIYFRF